MATLPAGWEWDYDGSRWLYRYKPTGHVQYHFPSAGDEFPDYIDASSPAPDLAPEERLESQQQVKRHASVGGVPGRAAAREDRDGWRSRMSATARPVSAVWDDDFAKDEDARVEEEPEAEAEEEGVFQPENFMFLGPGTYTDVSPLVEEEEEAARRTVVGGERNGGQQTDNRGVSPLVSQNTTPMVQTSETVATGSTTAVDERAVEPPPPMIQYHDPAAVVSPQEFIVGDDIVGEASAPIDGGYSYDMFELPAETAVPMHLQFDPVGTVPEMPTEHTAPSRAEMNPDPIELADNYVMAPIETEPRPGFVELPAEVTPPEEGAVREERLTEEQKLELRRQEVRRQQEERQREVKKRQEERKRREDEELQMELRRQQQNEAHGPTQEQSGDAPTPFKIARKPTLRESSATYNAYAVTGQKQDDYQPFAPGQAPQQTIQPTNSFPARIMSPALQREGSLNMSMRPSTASAPQMGPQLPTGVGPSASSHLLTSIEEHDESQHGAAAVSPLKVKQRKALTKPPPFDTLASPLDKGGPQQPVQQNVLQGQRMPVQQQVPPQGQPLAYGQAPHMNIAPQPAPVLIQGGPIMQPGQSQSHAMPMQGFQPLDQNAQPQPQQYQLRQQPQQRVSQALPASPSAAQPAPLPPLQTSQQTSPTSSGKENRKSWGKWFKSSGSKSAAQTPVAQQPQQTFPPVPIPQPIPGANEFGMQACGQQFPMDQPSSSQTFSQGNAFNNPSQQQYSTNMAPAPLFSGGSASTRPVAGSQNNKWAGKSPVDYSGGDWGDDDDEFS
ncbi:hypothetical protein CCMA1212_003980 [Trichoderma ghanense]|uniref:WW domain-containing protein n=1 Tax=Trichoderma ghanense TaxID=65468 RepID=A0ABY2H8E1_9HYPO